MTSKIGASAAALARDAFFTNDGNSLRSVLASSHASAGKGQSAAPANSSSSADEYARNAREPSSSYAGPHLPNGQETIRSPDNIDVEDEYDIWLSKHGPTGSLAGLAGQRPPDAPSSPPLSWVRDYGTNDHHPVAQSTPAPQISASDGAEVVALLASPSFNTETGTPPNLVSQDTGDDDDPSSSADLFTHDIPPTTLGTLNALKADLPAPPTYPSRPVDDPLSLLPDAAMAPAHRERWISDWDGFLHRYADEVWGDLLPLVADARAEVKEAKDKEARPRAGEEGSAVKRLALILGHLKPGSGGR
ncbi:MAG: hypothetical protein M1832_002082 [Thelocarpon impressellum]|nr:MAG: hypothetical protein M1832_002082 [Thelocarpon impressellum]